MFAFTEKKYEKLAFKILCVSCAAAALICLICDLAVNVGLTWSAYVIMSLIFAILTASPFLLLRNKKLIKGLAAISILILPYLLVLSVIHGGYWFLPLAAPISLIGIAVVWIDYFVFTYFKFNYWIKAAITVLVVAVSTAAINMISNSYIYGRLFTLSDIISLISCLAVATLLYMIGTDKIPKK